MQAPHFVSVVLIFEWFSKRTRWQMVLGGIGTKLAPELKLDMPSCNKDPIL